MKLLTFHSGGRLRTGVKTDRGVLDVTAVAGSIGDVIASGEAGLNALRAHVGRGLRGEDLQIVSEEDLKYGPCVPSPGKILCIGLNYWNHAQEIGSSPPEYPILFSKFGNATAASGEDIPIPEGAGQVDYEAELAVVMGRTARNVPAGEALSRVFGYCNANDVSARDLQFRTPQWLLGKTCDRFAPIGPYLVTADEVEDPNALKIRCRVNGQVRQDSSTADMIFSCGELVSYISRYMTLEPGDLILTGTPEGVILGQPEERREWLKAGDRVEVEVEGLGVLSNRMARSR